MIIKEKMIDPFNEQIQSEFTASAQYVAIAIYFDDRGLPELGRFFYRQAEEEREHAMKFVHFMLETGAKPLVSGLPDIRNEFGSAAEAVEFALNQEKKVTGQIYDLVTLATEAQDYASHKFLQWFVEEQVEEESVMTALLQTIKLAGDNLLLVEDYVRRNPQHADE
jgi:bacterioferritin B